MLKQKLNNIYIDCLESKKDVAIDEINAFLSDFHLCENIKDAEYVYNLKEHKLLSVGEVRNGKNKI